MAANHGAIFKNARDSLFELLSDLKWHPHFELKRQGGVRYSARLLELKRLGYKIKDRAHDGHPVGKDYRLVSKNPGAPKEKQVKMFLSEEDALFLTRVCVTPTARSAARAALISFRANKHKL